MSEQPKPNKPIVGITLGDFNGIGPELILRVLHDPFYSHFCTPVVYGSAKIFNRYKKLLHLDEQTHGFYPVKDLENLSHKKTNLLNLWEEDYETEPGKVTEQAGKCALLSLQKAVSDLGKGHIQALVTSPINKDNIRSEGFPFVGHTEYLAHHFHTKEVLMFMVSEKLKIGVATEHIPVEKIKEYLTPAAITGKLKTMLHSLKNDFGIPKPRVALLGLNPHAGDNGTIGREDQEIVRPVVNAMREKGELVFGPYPADGFFAAETYRQFDAVLAMYHDQGLIPFKMLAFEDGVNFTAGLPVVRTSPDHGTAYDLAGKGVADDGSFRQAIYTACDILKNRANQSAYSGTKPVSVTIEGED